ncbi:hypothetical protein MOO46_06490 [Apilactobacillus apisilvae]|uniref:Uncharacterized protein n=1 Tax=Apilactobacillus apisilvae TaxID=2923364 RepID=A0ABY4PHE7_9LACO|nr:hypothetical protein [Apilactobacillus apisilvae]UQS84886.1 hypothetical protein MOO46_06490 [Apilactobacillus apisilvae]
MNPVDVQKTLNNLKRTRSHMMNAFDSKNEKSNVISDIDNLTNYLKSNDHEIDSNYVNHKLKIIKGEINCSMHCFTNALNSLN